MKAQPLRVVLAFYSSEENHAERAFRALRGQGKVCLAGADSSKLDEICARYYGLRLEGESLVVVETATLKIEAIVATLRLEGSPAIFVVRPGFAAVEPATPESKRPTSQF